MSSENNKKKKTFTTDLVKKRKRTENTCFKSKARRKDSSLPDTNKRDTVMMDNWDTMVEEDQKPQRGDATDWSASGHMAGLTVIQRTDTGVTSDCAVMSKGNWKPGEATEEDWSALAASSFERMHNSNIKNGVICSLSTTSRIQPDQSYRDSRSEPSPSPCQLASIPMSDNSNRGIIEPRITDPENKTANSIEPHETATAEEDALEHRAYSTKEEPRTVIKRSYFSFCIPTVGIRRCAGCTLQEVQATVWCCECSRCLCSQCDARMHDTDAVDSLQRPLCSHRVEYIVGGGGLPILSPLLEWTVLAGSLYMICPIFSQMGTLLNVDYFFESVCPIVQQLRRLVFRLDHALYPLVRGQLGEWCDTEDAFLKIFSDLWVRGILTHTDSFALLLLKIPATVGALLIYLTVLPLFAVPYAVVATSVRLIEAFLFPNWMITRFLAIILRIVGNIIWLPLRLLGLVSRSTALGFVMETDFKEHFHRRIKIPPKTGARKRPFPSRGLFDIQLVGVISRITRIFFYFHRKARRAIVTAMLSVVFWTLALRILLLSLPRCGSGLLSKYAEEEMWYLLSSYDRESDEATTDSGLSRTAQVPDCVSIDLLARKISLRLGVEIPEFASLGTEGRVLARMQSSTENDYLDKTLQRVCYSLYLRFLELPSVIRGVLQTCLAMCVFSGLVRWILFGIDLRRRRRFHRMRTRCTVSTIAG